MSELRKDVVTGRWVIIASERSKRPDDFRPAASRAREDGATAFCPFCAGSEAKTPPEVSALRSPGTQPDTPGWRVRVVPNKFPALERGRPPSPPPKVLFPRLPGVGVHEVVIENPDHERELADLPADHVRDVLGVFRDRIRAIEEDLQYQYVQVFKNKGKEAGASLSHPHSQIVATPIVPKRVKEEIYGAERALRSFKDCVFCRTLEEEAKGERLVFENAGFRVIAPYASRVPFESTLFPIRHSPFFTDVSGKELDDLAAALKTILLRFKETLADPPYNLILHQAPHPALSSKTWPELGRSFHWHIEIFPVLTKVAGFEWGTGIYINPVPPETAAGFLRNAGPSA